MHYMELGLDAATFKRGAPYHRCPCDEKEDDEVCEDCRGTGWVRSEEFDPWEMPCIVSPGPSSAFRRNTPERVRRAVIRRDGQICQLCKKPVPFADMELDHIQPVILGGPTVVENLRVTHGDCNRRRKRFIKDWV